MSWIIKLCHANPGTTPVVLETQFHYGIIVHNLKIEEAVQVLSHLRLRYIACNGKVYCYELRLSKTLDGLLSLQYTQTEPSPHEPLPGFAFQLKAYGFLHGVSGERWCKNETFGYCDFLANSVQFPNWKTLWSASMIPITSAVDPDIWPVHDYIDPVTNDLIINICFNVFAWPLVTAIRYHATGEIRKVPMYDLTAVLNLPENIRERKGDLCIYMEDGVITAHFYLVCQRHPGIREDVEAGRAIRYGEYSRVKVERENFLGMCRTLSLIYGVGEEEMNIQ